MAVRTLAPQGQAPVLRVKLTRGHLSAINGIRLDECLFIRVRPTSYDAEAVVGALLACTLTQDQRLDCAHLGRLACSSRSPDQGRVSSGERPNACIWNNCLAMPPISTLMKASGTISSEWSWAMSVVPISISCIVNSSKPKNVCATKRRSSKAAPVSVATWFSFLARGQ